MEYHLTWKIELDADSPEDAAQKALAVQRDPGSWATQFEVRDANKQTHQVDLGCPAQHRKPSSVYILVPMEDGVVRGVQAFRTQEAAERAKHEWLRLSG